MASAHPADLILGLRVPRRVSSSLRTASHPVQLYGIRQHGPRVSQGSRDAKREPDQRAAAPAAVLMVRCLSGEVQVSQ